MIVQIEISEETSALIWANYWNGPDLKVSDIVKRFAEDNAKTFKRQFPNSVNRAVEDFREFQKGAAL